LKSHQTRLQLLFNESKQIALTFVQVTYKNKIRLKIDQLIVRRVENQINFQQSIAMLAKMAPQQQVGLQSHQRDSLQQQYYTTKQRTSLGNVIPNEDQTWEMMTMDGLNLPEEVFSTQRCLDTSLRMSRRGVL
jgi:D-arabinose 1-dehydrogenase-like Zn-dependent alcohol dehydrogenase